MTLEGALLLKNLPDPAPMTLLDVMETSSVEPELEKWSWASGIVIFIGNTTEQSMNKKRFYFSLKVTSSVLYELK